LLLVLLTPDDVLRNAASAGSAWQGLSDRAWTLNAAGVFLWCAAWIGWWPLRWLTSPAELPWWERAVFATGLGLHLISLLTLLIGLMGWLHTPAIAIVLGFAGSVLPIAAWLLSRGSVKGVARLFRPAMGQMESGPAEKDSRRLPPPLESRLWTAAVAVTALFALIVLLGAALPPWDFDVREYHLQVPKEWYLAGRIEFLPHNIYANMPLGAEMFPLAAMSGLGDWWLGAIVGKTVMGACAVVTAAAIYALVRRLTSPLAAVVAALVWLSHPWAIHVSISGLNEQVYALYLTLAVAAVATRDASWRNWLLAGLFAGAAAACKYPAVVMLVVPLAAWAAIAPRLRDFRSAPVRSRLMAATCFLVACVASGGAWYAKNAIQAGNPVYPLLANVLDGKTRTPEKNEQFARGHAVPPYTALNMVDSALRIGWQSKHQSPLLIPLVLMGALAVWRMTNDQAPMTNSRPLVIGIWSLVICFLATWWLFTHRLDRFLVPAIPLAAVLAGLAVEFAVSRPLKWVVYPFLTIGLLYCLAYTAYPMPVSVLALSGDNRWLVPLAELIRDQPRGFQGVSRINGDVRWLNDNVPAGQRVLCIGEAAVFDLEMPVYYHTCFDDCLLVNWMADKSAAERKQWLRDRHIAFVYVDFSEIARYQTPGNYGFDPRFSRALLDELVQQRVLAPPLHDAPAEMYRVVR
jgi:hypothetical protein